MHSFYLPRPSGLHNLYPLTKLALAAGPVAAGFAARGPEVPIALFLGVVLPLAAWGRIAGSLLRVLAFILFPYFLSVLLVQGLFFPGATRVIVSLGPLALKEEGLVFAVGTASRILLLAGAGLLLLFSTHPADLALALRERGMPGALAYIVVTAIQLIPQTQARASAIVDAQRARGLETEGQLLTRIRALIPLLGPLILGALAEVDERAMALDARAFSAPGIKTSYKELPDTRLQVWTRRLVAAATILAVGVQLWPR